MCFNNTMTTFYFYFLLLLNITFICWKYKMKCLCHLREIVQFPLFITNKNHNIIYYWRKMKLSGCVYQSSRWSTPRHAILCRIIMMTTTPSSIGPTFEKLTKPFHETRLSLWVWRHIIPCLPPNFHDSIS